MKARRPLKITSRTSSITNSFVQAILPTILPTQDDLERVLVSLNMSVDNAHCAYCGQRSTDWDHLYPLVKGKRPSGYLNEAANLVPCCGPCNQSKSGRHWREWMEGRMKNMLPQDAANTKVRIEAIERLEQGVRLECFPFESVVESEKWAAYWAALQDIEDRMREAQKLADEIRTVVQAEYVRRQSNAGSAASR